VARRAFQAPHGIAELGALDGLKQEFIGPGAHALDHRLAIRAEIAHHHEEVRHRLLHLLDCLDGTLGIARDIHDQAGVRMTFQILQDANVEVGSHLLVFGNDLRFGQINQVVAHRFAEMLVTRSDQ